MKKTFLVGFLLLTSSAFAGGGGGLDFDHKVREVKKMECRSGETVLTFIDITYRDPEIGLFDSTNLFIQSPGGAKPQNFFVWAHSVLKTVPGVRILKLEKMAMIERSWVSKESYFDIEVDFVTGRGTLAVSDFNPSKPSRFDDPSMTMSLSDCIQFKR